MFLLEIIGWTHVLCEVPNAPMMTNKHEVPKEVFTVSKEGEDSLAYLKDSGTQER